MDREIISIWLSFALYGLYFLLPLIPSILIYKIFPDTSVSTSGSLANFKINSSGAFAAYLATLLISIFSLSGTQDRILNIKNPIEPTWTIKGSIELYDVDNKIVNKPNLFDQVDVSIKPEIFTNANGDINFKIPGTTEGTIPQRMITIDVRGFGKGKINLTSINPTKCDEASIDYEHKIISFNKPIKIKTLNDPNQPYKQQQYMN